MIDKNRRRSPRPIIKPISDLVHTSHEPVFITKNGEGEMERTLELYEKLAVAEAQATAGNRGRPLDCVMANLRTRIRAFK